jgi:alpha-glucosidase (family GH31 glycosyl hydrolase)
MGSIDLQLGNGTMLVVATHPFGLSLLGPGGRTTVATAPGRALGWTVGAAATVTNPAPPFMGDDVAHPAAGLPVYAGTATVVRRSPDLVSLAVATPAGPAQVTVHRAGAGATLSAIPPSGVPVAGTVLNLASPAGEALFGLGGRKDAFDQRGLDRVGWVEEQNSGAGPLAPATDPVLGPTYTFPNGAQATYYPQAVLYGLRGWGVWETSTARYDVDLARSTPDTVSWSVDDPAVTWGLAAGGVEAASEAFTAAIGRAPAPPAWVHLPWVDVINQGEGEAAPLGSGFTGGARVAADVRTIATQAAQQQLPIGVIGMEGWQSVPGIAQLSASLRARGFHLSAYWNPFVSPSNAAYPAAAPYLVQDPASHPYPVLTTRGSADTALDFTNPATTAFWRQQVVRSCALGFDGWMEDFGEFVTEGMRFHDGSTPDAEHNAYPGQYHRAGAAAARDCGPRAFFYVRAGFTTTPADTAGAFPGDETTDWSRSSGIASVVPAMLNLALGGVTAFSTDVGGYLDLYTPRTTPELLARWTELAAFTSVLRLHNSTYHGELYPWQAGPQVLDIFRRYARAKVRLAPLVDRLSQQAARDGTVGPVRPLVLDDPSPAAAAVNDEWLLGHDLLVAPVLTAGATNRSVYLPATGSWRQARVAADGSLQPFGSCVPGGRRVTAPAPLADIPVFQHC